MNARILVTFLFILTIFSVQGQGQRFKAGIIAGFNACQIDGDNVGGYSHPGVRAGIRASTILKDKWRVDTDILFSQRGSRASATDLSVGIDNFVLGMDYVERPLGVRFSDWYVSSEDYHKVFVKAGLTYGRLIQVRHSDFSGYEILDEYINNDDLAGSIGLGFYPKKHLVVELNWTKSFFPFYRSGNGPYLRNMIGYYFSMQIMYEI